MGYKPELDISTPLEPELASYYQSLIGVMRWMCEIGRIDIALEVSMMSSHNAYPREGHFETVLHMMGYLKKKHNSRLAMDPNYPGIDEESFRPRDWSQQYGDIKEAIPINAPAPRGKEVVLRMMVDSDHAGDTTDRRSRTGYMIYVNMALIDWLSKVKIIPSSNKSSSSQYLP